MAAAYVQSTRRKVPGLADLHRMATILLAEHAGPTARILVVGAGGGLELKAFAEARPGPFDGAASLLTLHFLDAGERLRTLR